MSAARASAIQPATAPRRLVPGRQDAERPRGLRTHLAVGTGGAHVEGVRPRGQARQLGERLGRRLAPAGVDGFEPGLEAQAGAEGERRELDAQAPQVGRQIDGLRAGAGCAAKEHLVAARRHLRQGRCWQRRRLVVGGAGIAIQPVVAAEPDHSVRLGDESHHGVHRDLDQGARLGGPIPLPGAERRPVDECPSRRCRRHPRRRG